MNEKRIFREKTKTQRIMWPGIREHERQTNEFIFIYFPLIHCVLCFVCAQCMWILYIINFVFCIGFVCSVVSFHFISFMVAVKPVQFVFIFLFFLIFILFAILLRFFSLLEYYLFFLRTKICHLARLIVRSNTSRCVSSPLSQTVLCF